MTKIELSEDERYPTYRIREASGSRYDPTVEVDEETLTRWRAAIEVFDEVQSEMAELYSEGQARLKHEQEIEKAEKKLRAAQAELDALRPPP